MFRQMGQSKNMSFMHHARYDTVVKSWKCKQKQSTQYTSSKKIVSKGNKEEQN